MLKKQEAKEASGNHGEMRVAIVQSRYHGDMTGSMESAARRTLIEAGLDDKNIETHFAPGSWEIPVVAAHLAQQGEYDAIIALGVIVKGDTYHFEMIADNVGRALMDLQTEYGIPVGMEILAVFKLDDARKRTEGEHNKGVEAANAVLEAYTTIVDSYDD